jgi:hypothetical protein
VPCPLFSSATAAARSAMDERERLSATERACRQAVAHWHRVWPALPHVFGGGKRLIANKAHGPFLHFKLRRVRDVARQSGKAVTGKGPEPSVTLVPQPGP